MLGRTLSHYKILEKLGAGGMGEVYVAEDTKLGRKVALKVLPPQMAEDAERRARFEREARAVAALNHPHIVTIHSVEECDGVHFITMEWVKGKTLTEIIPEKGFPLNTFFEIAIPLADAVSAAHEQGIIHRDLKPDNLMVTEESRLKILDFGLAKLKPMFSEAGASELPTRSATGEGKILGTVAYMSPEQAEGKTVDHRTDIFSIGILLYEMATGERPFKGESTLSVLSSILRDTPPSATEKNPALPRELEKILRRCLNKNPEYRYQTAKDIRNELVELKRDLDSGEVVAVVPQAAPRKKAWGAAVVIAAAVVAGALGYLLSRVDTSDRASGPMTGGTLTQLTSLPGREGFPSLSPDGKFVAYTGFMKGSADIYLQRVDGQNAINLTPDSPASEGQPQFSPDGSQIAFARLNAGIFVMGATGESVKRVTDHGYNPVWSPDGDAIAYSTVGIITSARSTDALEGQIRVVDLESGAIRHVTPEGMDAVQPHWSPGGQRIAYWSSTEGVRDVWTIPAAGGEAVPATHDSPVDWNPVWSPDGRFLYFLSDRGGTMSLWRIAVDEMSGVIRSEPELMLTTVGNEMAHLSISGDGRQIAYSAVTTYGPLLKIAFDPDRETVIGEPLDVWRGSKMAMDPQISPDGEWIAFSFFLGAGKGSVALVRPDGTDLREVTDGSVGNFVAAWSPNGEEISFNSNRSGSYEVWSIHRDGSGLRQITDTPERFANGGYWSPEGTLMAFSSDTEPYLFDPREPWNAQTPQTLPPGDIPGHFVPSEFSPDGRRLAGHWEGGEEDYPLALYDLDSNAHQIFEAKGLIPIWLADSRRLLYGSFSNKMFLLDTVSGDVREILSNVRAIFSISRDNRWIYFSRRVQEADIWMFTLDREKE
jgi:Tol biopolymer transport system component